MTSPDLRGGTPRCPFEIALDGLEGTQRILRCDDIVRQVREGYRNLLRARLSHEIQEQGVALAEQRVASTADLLEAGRASTRDRLDAAPAGSTATQSPNRDRKRSTVCGVSEISGTSTIAPFP